MPATPIEPLVDIELLKTRLLIGEDGLVDTDNLKQALFSSEQLISSLLRTDLRKIEATEVFYVVRSDLVLDGTQVQLQTRNGFIGEIEITQTQRLHAQNGKTVSTYLADTEKGILTIPFDDQQGYFTVTYKSGFEPTDELPEWLTNLILLGTEVVYNMPSNGKEDRGTSSSREQIDAIVAEHSRLANRAVKGISYAVNQP